MRAISSGPASSVQGASCWGWRVTIGVTSPKRICDSLLASSVGVVVDGAVDFADSPDDARFRATLRAWLAANRPARAERVPHDDASLAEEFAFLRDWQRRLHDAGYVGLLWPREYGGGGGPPRPPGVGEGGMGRGGGGPAADCSGVQKTRQRLHATGGDG